MHTTAHRTLHCTMCHILIVRKKTVEEIVWRNCSHDEGIFAFFILINCTQIEYVIIPLCLKCRLCLPIRTSHFFLIREFGATIEAPCKGIHGIRFWLWKSRRKWNIFLSSEIEIVVRHPPNDYTLLFLLKQTNSKSTKVTMHWGFVNHVLVFISFNSISIAQSKQMNM